jgi:hypothetical protein
MSNDDSEDKLTSSTTDDVPTYPTGLNEPVKPSDDCCTFPTEISSHVVVIDGSKRNTTTVSAATDLSLAGASETSTSRRSIPVRRISAPLLPMPVFTGISSSALPGPPMQLQRRRGSGSGLPTTADEPYIFSRTQLSGTSAIEQDLRTAVGNVLFSTSSKARRRLSDPVCGRSWYSNRANWSAAVVPSSTSSRDSWTSAFTGDGNFDVGGRRNCCEASSGATATPPPSPTSAATPDGSISGPGFAEHGKTRRRHSFALGQLSSSSQLNAIDEEGGSSAGGGAGCNHCVAVNCTSCSMGGLDSDVSVEEGSCTVTTANGQNSTSTDSRPTADETSSRRLSLC